MYIENAKDGAVVIKTGSVKETLQIGEIIGSTVKQGSIIALNGNLGAGKTVLVKGIARGLDIEEEPNSPTFVILQTYSGKYPLYHFDFYRLSSFSELDDLNFEDFFYGQGVTVVEWAERISEVFPEYSIMINIEITENDNENPVENRSITIKGEKKWLLSFKNMVEQALQT